MSIVLAHTFLISAHKAELRFRWPLLTAAGRISVLLDQPCVVAYCAIAPTRWAGCTTGVRPRKIRLRSRSKIAVLKDSRTVKTTLALAALFAKSKCKGAARKEGMGGENSIEKSHVTSENLLAGSQRSTCDDESSVERVCIKAGKAVPLLQELCYLQPEHR